MVTYGAKSVRHMLITPVNVYVCVCMRAPGAYLSVTEPDFGVKAKLSRQIFDTPPAL